MYISIDLGGTNTRIAVSKDLKSIDKKIRFPTSKDYDTQITNMKKELKLLTNGQRVSSICIGVPGFVDYKNNRIEKVINVPYLSNFDISKLFDTKVSYLVANDADIAGLGESIYGVGKDFKTLVYITLSTGVGGVRIYNKKLDTTQSFSEPGHIVVHSKNDTSDLTGQIGGWDSLVSGVNFISKYQIHPKDCVEQKIWDTYGVNVSRGLISIIALWAPDVIVLGGSMSEKFSLFEDSMNASLTQFNADIFKLPKIVKSNLGHDNGLLGGFAYINQILNS